MPWLNCNFGNSNEEITEQSNENVDKCDDSLYYKLNQIIYKIDDISRGVIR